MTLEEKSQLIANSIMPFVFSKHTLTRDEYYKMISGLIKSHFSNYDALAADNARIESCRDYLMSTRPDEINISHALVALGFNEQGL